MNNKFDNIIKKLFFSNNKLSSKFLKLKHDILRNPCDRKYTNILEYLNNRYVDSSYNIYTDKIEKKNDLKEILYRIYYNIEVRPVCKVCGKHTKFCLSYDTCYNTYCSSKCFSQDIEVINKIVSSNQKTYNKNIKEKGYKRKPINKECERYIKAQTSKELFLAHKTNKILTCEHYDNLIVKAIFINNYLVNNKLFKKLYNYPKKYKNRYSNIQEYLANRFEDSESLLETLYRILYKIEQRPKCKTCGKVLTPYIQPKKHSIFQTFCSISCENKDKEVKEKQFNKKIERYGAKSNGKKISESLQNRTQEEIDKATLAIKRTKFEKYGDENYNNLEKTKQTLFNKYEVTCSWQIEHVKNKANTPEAKEKEYITKKKNNSFKKSKDEDILYEMLLKIYPNTERNFLDDRYKNIKYNKRWRCDFYIPDLDMFIEYQGTWFHGTHPFDSTSEEDLKELEIIKEKDRNCYTTKIKKKKSAYLKHIEVWTKLDVEKRNVAKNNNLNYVELWNLTEAKEFINKLNIK